MCKGLKDSLSDPMSFSANCNEFRQTMSCLAQSSPAMIARQGFVLLEAPEVWP